MDAQLEENPVYMHTPAIYSEQGFNTSLSISADYQSFWVILIIINVFNSLNFTGTFNVTVVPYGYFILDPPAYFLGPVTI